MKNNTSIGRAGAISGDSDCWITRCVFDGNYGTRSAGAVWSFDTTIIDDCDFTGNSTAMDAGDGGGAILTENGTVYVTNSRSSRIMHPSKAEVSGPISTPTTS